MCGGFTSLAANSQKSFYSQILYHCGRLLTYLSLGYLAGSIGSQIDKIGSEYGLIHFATIITATLLILSGLMGIIRGYVVTIQFLPHRVSALLQPIIKFFIKRPMIMPFVLGISTTLLPCGWLYTYLIIAAGTGSSINATLVMAFFWAGTLPLLLVTGAVSTLATTPLKKYAPLIASLLMMFAGGYSLFTHLNLFPGATAHTHSCAMHPASESAR